MSEHSFQEVMREKMRMHKYFFDVNNNKSCHGCPIRPLCDKPHCEWGEEESKEIESIVMKWAKEHPVPVYPTWAEWLKSIGMIARAKVSITERSPFSINIRTEMADILTDKADEPIPEELAVKIGLKPKKVKPNA